MRHKKFPKLPLCVFAVVILFTGAPAALAAGAYTQIGTIAVPGGLTQFDILWIDTSWSLVYERAYFRIKGLHDCKNYNCFSAAIRF